MATIGSGFGSYLNSARRSYITTAAFHADIFAYTTSFNAATFATTGTLTSLSTLGTATAANCPANRVLRETGKKLYPSGMVNANDTTYGSPNPGVRTYMVGVYDPNTFLTGFIDPNAKIFAIYNSDKPDYVARGLNPNGGFTELDTGAPVYTLGSVTAGTTVTAGTGVVATAGQVRAATITPLTSITANGAQTAQNLDATLGSIFTITISPPSGVASITLDVPTAAVVAGARIELLITATTAFNTTITFGTNIVSNSTYIVTSAATSFFAISFVCNGTQFFEVSRTATQA